MNEKQEKLWRQWQALAELALSRAERSGVELELKFGSSDSLSVKVRKGELEELRQSGPMGVSLRLFKGRRAVSGSSAHVDAPHLEKLVARLIDNVALVDEEEANGLPEQELLYKGGADLDLLDPAVAQVTVDQARELALTAERAAFAVDTRINNSSGAAVGTQQAFAAIFNSRGLSASESASGISLSVSPVAEDAAGEKYAEWWFSTARHLSDLEAAEKVGRVAGERCVALIGATKIATGKAPVLFVPETAKDLVSLLFGCASGDAVYRNATFLAEAEGKPVASELVTIVDDPLMRRGIGSAPFDSEGVATRTTKVVEQGVLKYHPCDTFSARRLGRKSTGHAGSGVTSYNLYLQRGETPAAQMMEKLGTGLVVSAFIGFSFNQATGDFSRGVRGFWVEGGKVVKPVQEVTVSGNLGQMLLDVVAVGDDLTFRFGTDSPSLLIREMTISGS